MFAIVDIETCGGTFHERKGRIIDICILIHDGLSVVDKFSTLINPECFISPFYTNISGITNEMVQDAPKFYEVARRIIEITEGQLFVAHNVNFDYSFVKDEFASLGYKYKRDTLCTVRLSRKLIPGRVSYSLGNLCSALNIENEARHRAEGDAVATSKLFDILIQLKTQHPQYKSMGVEEIMARRIDKIKKYILDKLPESCGVYYFLDKAGNIIYIGKSTNMYNRALSHFNNDAKKARNMLNDLYNVDYVETGSELIALLLEGEEIKKHKPIYNSASKDDNFLYSLDWNTNEEGIICLRLVPYGEAQNPLTSFLKYGTALEKMAELADTHELCLHHCGPEEAEGVCFNYQVKKCRGICGGHEYIEAYNKRAMQAINKHRFHASDFAIFDKGRNPEEQAFIIVSQGTYRGFGYIDGDTQLSSPQELKEMVSKANYYPDADALIKSWIRKNPQKKLVNL